MGLGPMAWTSAQWDSSRKHSNSELTHYPTVSLSRKVTENTCEKQTGQMGNDFALPVCLFCLLFVTDNVFACLLFAIL